MRRLMNDNHIREISSSVNIRTKGLDLLDNQTVVGSLLEDDEYSSDEMKQFWSNLKTYGNRLLLDVNYFLEKC